MTRIVLGGVLLVSMGMAAEQAPKRPISNDMQRAIEWERHKEAAAASQARREARHPSVTYNNADRSADRSAPDPGEPEAKAEKATPKKDK